MNGIDRPLPPDAAVLNRDSLEALKSLQSEGDDGFLKEMIELFLEDTPARLADMDGRDDERRATGIRSRGAQHQGCERELRCGRSARDVRRSRADGPRGPDERERREGAGPARRSSSESVPRSWPRWREVWARRPSYKLDAPVGAPVLPPSNAFANAMVASALAAQHPGDFLDARLRFHFVEAGIRAFLGELLGHHENARLPPPRPAVDAVMTSTWWRLPRVRILAATAWAISPPTLASISSNTSSGTGVLIRQRAP